MKTLASIQAMRAFAAMAVVSYHACQWITAPVAVGAAGVDVFFVISGFVMWTTSWSRPIGPRRFLWRRATRVIPLYWLLTLCLAAAAWLRPGVFPHVVPKPGHIALSLLFVPHMDPEGWPFPLLAPGWTLNYEALFYLVFAATLWAPRERRLAWLAGVMAAGSVAGLFYVPLYTFIANPMLLQFVAGAAVGRLWLMRALPGARWGIVMMLAALALLAGSHLIHVVPESLGRPFLWGLPALLLVTGAVCAEPVRLFRPAAVQRIGDASYSIYLCHVPVMALFNRAIGPTNPALFFGAAMLLSLIVGLACHLWIERPMLALMRRRPWAAARLPDSP